MAYTAGTRLTAAMLNTPVARLRQTATQTLTSGTYAPVTLTTEDYDSHTGHSTSVNTSRYTVQSGWAGVYRLSGGVAFAANATGSRGCRWLKNGSPLPSSGVMLPNNGATTASRIPAQTISVDLAVGDYVELDAFQDRGGNLDTLVSSDAASFVDIMFIRSL